MEFRDVEDDVAGIVLTGGAETSEAQEAGGRGDGAKETRPVRHADIHQIAKAPPGIGGSRSVRPSHEREQEPRVVRPSPALSPTPSAR